jgi:hypothetical protein
VSLIAFKMSRQKNVDEQQHLFRFGVCFPRQVISEIDEIRGDTNRTLWLKRLAIKELERQQSQNQKLKEEQEELKKSGS